MRHEVVMLLDNHYGPDARVAFEAELLAEAGVGTRIVAWDRRSEKEGRGSGPSEPPITRIAVPAPSGGGWRSVVAVARFGRAVWHRRRRLVEGTSLLVVHDIYLLPLGWLLARRLRIPFVYDAHEEYARMEAERHPPWILRLVTAIESRLARSARAVVVPGASRAVRWDGVLEQPLIVLPNLVRREQAPPRAGHVEWDLLYVGILGEARRPDLLIELARRRPELRVAVAGHGRRADDVARAASELPNLVYLGWRADAEELFARTSAIYYGLDPRHPYSDVACPNTLYQALRHRKPLVFFCGGEMAQLATEFKIGIRCAANVDALSTAIDRVVAADNWEFDQAWHAVGERGETNSFVEVVKSAMRSGT